MKQEQDDMLIANARIVLADRVIENGWLACAGGKIVEIGEGPAPERGEDAGGDLVLPGLVELHTDHLEAHYVPRPKVYWDPVAAVVSYDGMLATSGITTVLDSLRVWREDGAEAVDGQHVVLADAIESAREGDLLRIEHYLHLRCEVPMPGVVDDTATMIGRDSVRLMSLMDHTPGHRQFRDEEKLRTYYRGKSGGLTDAQLDVLFAKRHAYHAENAERHRRELVALATQYRTPLACHDDTTMEHVAESIADGAAIAEFPTTLEAAEGLHHGGIRVLMGAPNLVRGGSHSGNIAAIELAQAGLLDILSSDYVPGSLIQAAFELPERVPQITLPQAIATVTSAPASAAGLVDRGRIGTGLRADMVRVRLAGKQPVVRSVWRQGERVA